MPKKLFFLLRCQLIFPHFSVPQHVCAAASKPNKNLRASKPNSQLSFWWFGGSDADSLLSFSLSHTLLLMVEDDGREERRRRVGFVQRCSVL